MQPVVFALALSVVVAVGVMVAVALPHLRGGAPILTQAGWRIAWKVLRGVQRLTSRGGAAPGPQATTPGRRPYPAQPSLPGQPYPAQQPHQGQQPYQGQQPNPGQQAYPGGFGNGSAPEVLDVRDPRAHAARVRRAAPPGPQPAEAGSERRPPS